MPKHIVLNVGMHRSGTSMVNRLLNLHGMHIPLETNYSDEYNPSGYWESFELQHINDQILKMGDSSWSDPRAFDIKRFHKIDHTKLDSMTQQFLDRLMEVEEEIILIKDPRMCRLIPIWLKLIEPTGAKVSAVFPIRNPLEVASSIRNRDQFAIETGLQLWLRNVVEAEYATRSIPRVFFEYHKALTDWPEVFHRIQDELELPNLRQPEEIQPEIAAFSSGSLKHWTFGSLELIAVAGKGSLISLAYTLIRELVGAHSESVFSELDDVRHKLNSLSTVEEALERSKMAQQTLGFSATEVSDLLDKTLFSNLLDVLEKIMTQVESQQKLVQMLECERENSSALIQTLRGKDETIEHLDAERLELEHRLEDAEQSLSELTAEKTDQANRLGVLTEELDNVRREMRQRESLSKQEKESLSKQNNLLSAIKDYQKRSLDDLKRQSDQTEVELRRALASLRDTLARTQANEQEQTRVINEMYAEMQSLSNAYLGLQDSLSWKITKPVRSTLGVFKHLLPVPGAAAAALSVTESEPAAVVTDTQDLEHTPETRQEAAHPSPLPLDPAQADPHPLIQAEIAGRRFVEPSGQTLSDSELPVNLIAFYLPQFHPIPENNEWWGEGFTEWTNVRPAKPIFDGHYQPRMPGELGFYDLLDGKTQQRQVELAKQYGIGGFCFYFYWFHGKRLLEQPVIQYRENKSLDLPYCLCWANENWSRTWDGLESHVLIGQEHSPEDDLAFIQYISQYFADERYIRIDGRPLLLVYRPSLLPDTKATADRWRNWCRQNGFGEIYLAYTQSFEIVDPSELGFDAAIEFPPNNTAPDIVTHELVTIDPDFEGYVYDYNSLMARSYRYEDPSYTLFRGVTPSWDNIARRPRTGAVFSGTTPERYREWLRNAVSDTVDQFEEPSKRLVFINAWNEWAEGAYLEPDGVYGHAYLEATRQALEDFEIKPPAPQEPNPKKLVLVAHDGHPHGAQYLSLNLARVFSSEFGFEVDLVVLGEGILIEEYKKWATVHELAGFDPDGEEARQLALGLVEEGHDFAICNTTVSGLFLKTLSDAGLRCISLVHELRNVILDNKLEEHARAIAEKADKVVFAAESVRDSFVDIAPVPDDRIVIRPQGLYKNNAYLGEKEKARSELRELLGIGEVSKIVLGVGFLDHRKGIDLFVEAGLECCAQLDDVYFVWIGHWHIHMEEKIKERLDGHELSERFIFPGRQDNTDLFYAGSDVFALTSREDPYPTTVMEALEVGIPTVGFEGAGGCDELLKEKCGVLVPMEDAHELSRAIKELLQDGDGCKNRGLTGSRIVKERFSFRHYLFDLLELAQAPLRKVSAIVPNYNYARHLEQRLRSIYEQSYPVFEVIILDDASTDESLDVIQSVTADYPDVATRVVVNETNSGSVFKQWRRGVDLARGELVWICEADDFAATEFLERCARKFDDSKVVIVYSQSRQVDENGGLLADNYLDYTDDVSPIQWRSDYVRDGKEEILQALAVKNTIPNVSAVLFSRNELHSALKKREAELSRLKIAGDWLLYSELLLRGSIAFVSTSLNSHRRHTESVTINPQNNSTHLAEILFMQEKLSKSISLENDSTRKKAENFARHAAQHLGLDETEFPTAAESVNTALNQLRRDSR